MSLAAVRQAPNRRSGYRLNRYTPEMSQGRHRHDLAHLSLIIAGSIAEECDGEERLGAAGAFVVRSNGSAHQVRFGKTGALILSAPLVDRQQAAYANQTSLGWSEAPNALVRLLFGSAAEGDEGAVSDAVWDLLATQSESASHVRAPWLLRARDELVEEAPTIADLAAKAGVHRVHFSRAFTQTFGVAPSVYRHRVRALRAAAAALDGEVGAGAAYDCGFADQSHMCRALRQMTGLSFTRLRTMSADVTSVQE